MSRSCLKHTGKVYFDLTRVALYSWLRDHLTKQRKKTQICFFTRKWTIPYSAFLFYVSFTHTHTLLQSQEKPLDSILFLPSVSTNRVTSWRDLFGFGLGFFSLIDFWREEESELLCKNSPKVEVTENIHMPKYLWGTPAETLFSTPGYIEWRKDLQSRNLNWPLALEQNAWKYFHE